MHFCTHPNRFFLSNGCSNLDLLIIALSHLLHSSTYILFTSNHHYSQTTKQKKDEEWQVEFEVGHDEDGKPKAENVTAPGGGPCTGPRKARAHNNRRRRRHTSTKNNSDGEMGGDATSNGKGDTGDGKVSTAPMKKEPQPLWHDTLSGEVKQALSDKSIRTSTGTLDISLGNARIKLGTRSYASIAIEDGILAEGSFHCDPDGNADFEWSRAIRFTDVWNPFLDLSAIINEVNLTDGEL